MEGEARVLEQGLRPLPSSGTGNSRSNGFEAIRM